MNPDKPRWSISFWHRYSLKPVVRQKKYQSNLITLATSFNSVRGALAKFRCSSGKYFCSSLLLYSLSLLSALLLASCQGTPPPQGVTVTIARVVSGQSLEIAGTFEGGENSNRVRLINIDAPDFRQQPWGEQAKKRLEELINNQPVLLESDIETKYCFKTRCSQLAYVWLNGTLLNEQLVKEGLVLAVPRLPNKKYSKRLAHAQEWARIMGRGIWNPDNPLRLPPDEFRRQNPQ